LLRPGVVVTSWVTSLPDLPTSSGSSAAFESQASVQAEHVTEVDVVETSVGMILVLASQPGARSGVYGPLAYSISYSRGMGEDEWEIYQTDEVSAWMRDLRRTDPQAAEKVEAAVDVLAEYGPTLGRPLVDTLVGSKLANLKELRPRQTNIRVLFVFDPWRSAILLVAGDKTGQWHKWYEGAIPQAEQQFALYLKERAKAEEEGRD
jgi:hypothetical protein